MAVRRGAISMMVPRRMIIHLVASTSRTAPSFSLRPISTLSRSFASTSKPTSNAPEYDPKTQLEDMQNMMDELAGINSKTQKIETIQRYPQLRELLETVYSPDHRAHVTPPGLCDYLENPVELDTNPTSSPNTLVELFDLLSEKAVSGNAAKHLIWSFLLRHKIIDPPKWKMNDTKDLWVYQQEDRNPRLRVFYKLLERNLIAGFGAKTLLLVPWPDRPKPSSDPKVIPSKQGGSTKIARSTTTASDQTSRPRNLVGFECALGKSISPPFAELSKRADKWYASRKLDGVRVVTLIDFNVPHDPSRPITVHSVQFCSRKGSQFTSLSNLETQLVHIVRFPHLREWLDRDTLVVNEMQDASVKRLVLDGEVCIMTRLQQVADDAKARTVGDDGTGASAIWEDDGLIEDFNAAVTQVRTNRPIEHPKYFLFDLISWVEFANRHAVDSPALGKPFGERAQETKELATWLKEELKRQGEDEAMMRALVQSEVKSGDVDGLVERAVNEGWEGLIFRADRPYKGSRSVDIRKFKQWQDAEYTVKSIDTSRMRLSVNGVTGEHLALSNVCIEHKGHPVSVGSGFTSEEKVKYAQNPDLIIGKEITVEYFEESSAADRSEVKSLRFPRIKKIWPEKQRDV